MNFKRRCRQKKWDASERSWTSKTQMTLQMRMCDWWSFHRLDYIYEVLIHTYIIIQDTNKQYYYNKKIKLQITRCVWEVLTLALSKKSLKKCKRGLLYCVCLVTEYKLMTVLTSQKVCQHFGKRLPTSCKRMTVLLRGPPTLSSLLNILPYSQAGA